MGGGASEVAAGSLLHTHHLYKWQCCILVGEDFTLSAMTFDFTAGQTQSSIVVTASLVEEDVDFSLAFTNPSTGLMIGDANTATVNIINSSYITNAI